VLAQRRKVVVVDVWMMVEKVETNIIEACLADLCQTHPEPHFV
jgi:hypothetical protein